jgi:hypothetical protein
MPLFVKFLESSKVGFWLTNFDLAHILLIFQWMNASFCLMVVIGLFAFVDNRASNTALHAIGKCD